MSRPGPLNRRMAGNRGDLAPPGTWLEERTVLTAGDDLAVLDHLLACRPAWHARAACRGQGTAAWFPDEPHARLPPEAAALCARCSVADECREAGMGQESGYWGGVAASRLRKERQSRARATREAQAAAMAAETAAREERNAEIVRLRDEGLSCGEIADRLGLGGPTVAGVLARLAPHAGR